MEKMRIDKWLWSARFYKTRSLAAEEIDKGRVQINGQDVKPARDVKAGDQLSMRQGPVMRTVVVKGLSKQRGAAPVAQLLYEETSESIANRQQAAEQRKLNNDPADSIEKGRPTKRDRRSIDKTWGDRWSASVD
jgi:ribosome-associated heat shock protein Hsp15